MLKEYLEKDIKLNKDQKLFIISAIIITSGFFGWFYEFIFYFFNSGMKQFYMRGSNFLPWINIYVYGSLLIILLAYKKRKNPLQVFLISGIATGILEYFSGYVLYGKLHFTRCWDYNQEILNFGNIDGYVCLRSVTVFALCGLLLIYGILPILIKISKSKNIKTIKNITMIICAIVLADEIYNKFIYIMLSLPKASAIYKELGLKYIYFN